MTTDTTTPASTPTRPRALRPWILAGAGTLAAGVAAAVVLPGLLAPPTVTTLTLEPTNATAMCMALSPELLRQGELAFRADVTGIDGGIVTLQVTERFQGDVGDLVQVEQGDGVPIDGAPIVFDAGESYLISSDGETIGSCSGSGVASPELEALFAEAFPG